MLGEFFQEHEGRESLSLPPLAARALAVMVDYLKAFGLQVSYPTLRVHRAGNSPAGLSRREAPLLYEAEFGSVLVCRLLDQEYTNITTVALLVVELGSGGCGSGCMDISPPLRQPPVIMVFNQIVAIVKVGVIAFLITFVWYFEPFRNRAVILELVMSLYAERRTSDLLGKFLCLRPCTLALIEFVYTLLSRMQLCTRF